MRKYRLVSKKGEGTFSEVLKAQNVKRGTYHAIKVSGRVWSERRGCGPREVWAGGVCTERLTH